LRPVVILLDIETFGGMRGTDKITHSLHERRVPVCVVVCDAKLTQVFSEFSTNFTTQENHSWRSPVLSR
jgi:predicted ATP-grasp superfamily ATP-dependent carboligase